MGKGIYAPGQGLFPKLTSGIVDQRLVISRGLANNTLIPRLWNPEEIIYIYWMRKWGRVSIPPFCLWKEMTHLSYCLRLCWGGSIKLNVRSLIQILLYQWSTICKRQVFFHKKRHLFFQKCGKLFSRVCGILFSIINSYKHCKVRCALRPSRGFRGITGPLPHYATVPLTGLPSCV